MTVETLRRKAIDRTPVLWPRMGVVGTVTRVARDGTWADMVWSTGRSTMPLDSWSKRQPLDRIEEWEHA